MCMTPHVHEQQPSPRNPTSPEPELTGPLREGDQDDDHQRLGDVADEQRNDTEPRRRAEIDAQIPDLGPWLPLAQCGNAHTAADGDGYRHGQGALHD